MRISDDSMARILKTKEVNKHKYNLIVVGPVEIRDAAKSDDAALKVLNDYFLPKI